MICDELASAIARRIRRAKLGSPLQAPGAPRPPECHFDDSSARGASIWTKYSSIESYTNANGLQKIRTAVIAKLGSQCDWIASEKVHGANFCFETDGQHIGYASRTSKLGQNAGFYSAHETMPRYHPHVLEAFRLAKRHKQSLAGLLIFGEYFGGYYPGHPVEPGRKKVQGGVAYSPDHHFYAFDVRLDDEEHMDFDDARALLLEAGFPLVAAPLKRGPLDELLAIDVEVLETTLPSQLGHPPLDRFRIAEGIVIRPAKEVQFGCHRAILKKKSKAFWEATNQPGMAGKVAVASGVFSSHESLLEATRIRVNENRLRSVISKDPGLLAESNLHKLAGLLARDVLEDLEKEHSEELKALGKEVSAIKRSIQFLARSFVTEHIQVIRDDVG
eukprot:TRINITY_DN13418_c0_g1_i1.p1 TRINITY_DN13418_c0_g1~~TRINITY_DN13418_c0_g1_i1.p1  ORF type:complete len:401 (+),score=49.67 TRINITY_DN13418_c0_g1_i1:37-1203(+)